MLCFSVPVNEARKGVTVSIRIGTAAWHGRLRRCNCRCRVACPRGNWATWAIRSDRRSMAKALERPNEMALSLATWSQGPDALGADRRMRRTVAPSLPGVRTAYTLPLFGHFRRSARRHTIDLMAALRHRTVDGAARAVDGAKWPVRRDHIPR